MCCTNDLNVDTALAKQMKIIIQLNGVIDSVYRSTRDTYDRKKRINRVFGRCDHVVASVEVGSTRYQYPITFILDILASSESHGSLKLKPIATLVVVNKRMRETTGRKG